VEKEGNWQNPGKKALGKKELRVELAVEGETAKPIKRREREGNQSN